MRLRRRLDELSGFYAAQAPEQAGTDDLWINLQPAPSFLTDSSAADAPLGKSLPRREDNPTASAVSFGFVAIAILVSMFLIIAIFERILRPRRHLVPLHHSHDMDAEFSEMSQRPLQWGSPPISNSSSKHSNVSYGKGVPVVMPGSEFPTFIAHPAPILLSETKLAEVCNSTIVYGIPRFHVRFRPRQQSSYGCLHLVPLFYLYLHMLSLEKHSEQSR